MIKRVILLTTLIYLIDIDQCSATLNLTSWKNIEDLSFKLSGRSVEFPCETTKDIYKESGRYIPQNILVTRMQIHKYDVVVAMPRYKSGVPITLGITHLKCKGCETKIRPFPNWPLQQEGNCDAIQSAVDIYLDRKGVLWVLDDGVVDSLGVPYQKCPPKVISIDMYTGKVTNTIDLSAFITEQSSLQYVVTESPGNGEDYVYVSDSEGGAIITFNARSGKGRRLVLPPNIIETCSARCALYLTIVMKANHENYLYFTYSECEKIYVVESSTIRDDMDCGAIRVAGKKPEGLGIVFCGTDNLSNLFFRQKDRNDIYMWDSNTPWKNSNWRLVQRGNLDRQTTQVAPGPWKLLWTMESNIYDFVTNNVGCFGASSYLHPIAKDVHSGSSMSLANKIGLN